MGEGVRPRFAQSARKEIQAAIGEYENAGPVRQEVHGRGPAGDGDRGQGREVLHAIGLGKIPPGSDQASHRRLLRGGRGQGQAIEPRGPVTLAEKVDHAFLRVDGEGLAVARPILVGEVNGVVRRQLQGPGRIEAGGIRLREDVQHREGMLGVVVADLGGHEPGPPVEFERRHLLPVAIGDARDLDRTAQRAVGIKGKQDGFAAAVVVRPKQTRGALGNRQPALFQVARFGQAADLGGAGIVRGELDRAERRDQEE